ncbi:MAG: hypothetical protein ACE5D6_00105 [Candidatus Zixiibacteriota bacterium]
MSSKKYLMISGIVFGLVALSHLLRTVFWLEIHVGTWMVPFWVSWIGVVGPGILCIWTFRQVGK